MAINDIVDIDEVIDEKLLLQQPIPTASMGDVQATASPGYYGPKTQKRELLSPDVKNYLLDKTNLSPDTLDAIVGAPYSVRDRYLNLNPIDAVRDLIRFGTPGDQPLGKDQQAFGLNVGELFSPRTAEIDAAERAGIDVDKGAPYKVQKDAAYLPADQRDRGIKALLKEAYPNVPLADLNVELEPRTNRVIYTDPETGGKQFVSPPGIDWPDVTAVMEPIMLEVGMGALGYALGSLPQGRLQGAVSGAPLGLAAATAMTDSGIWQLGGAAAGATAGAISSPLTFTVAGETMGHYLWRYQNLTGMKERGILDETYTPEKIQQTAIDDSKVVGAWSIGGNAAFATFAKFLGANPINIGVDKETFVNAWETAQGMKTTASGPAAQVVETLTTPQVLGVSDVGTTGQRGILQREVDLAAESSVDVERKVIGQQNVIRQGYDDIFAETGVNPQALDLGDPVVLKQSFGNRIINDIDLEDLKDLPTDEKALANKLKSARDSNEPEALFDAIWRDGRISNTETLLKVLPEESIGDFQKLIYRDFVEKGSNDSAAITRYLQQHGEGLKVVFGDEFVDGLNTYNKIIKSIDVQASKGLIVDDAAMTMTTNLARAYVGIFTRPGRVITAINQVRRKLRLTSFEDMILDPEKLYKRIQRGERLEKGAIAPKIEEIFGKDGLLDSEFRVATRALGRYYGQEDGGTSKAEPDQPSALPVATPDVSIDLEGLEMNRGGSPLIELKYNY